MVSPHVTYPGVYVQEVPSGVHTTTGVSTSDTAFVDVFARGPVGKAVRVTSFAHFERKFGGLHPMSEASYAIMQFYLNGGANAWVVRVAGSNAQAAMLGLPGGSSASTAGPGPSSGSPPTVETSVAGTLTISGATVGAWGNNLQVAVDHNNVGSGEFNVVVREVATSGGKVRVVGSEVYRKLSMDKTSARYVVTQVNQASSLVQVTDDGAGVPPNPTSSDPTVDVTSPSVIGSVKGVKGQPYPAPFKPLGSGSDSAMPNAETLIGDPADKTGIYALDTIAPFVYNIMCLPAASNYANITDIQAAITRASEYCEEKRAFMIVDIPKKYNNRDLQAPSDMVAMINDADNGFGNIRTANSAVYYPRLETPDPLNGNRLRDMGPSGTMAGIYARTDASRGVWKAPAGIDATLTGAEVARKVNDPENGDLNMLGVNVLRTFPVYGNISWGARTLEGADLLESEWKYIPVRRLTLYVEESLSQGIKWAVFEPNDEPLWPQIRLRVGAFMADLFLQGAFQGTSAKDAYFVKCSSETTTQEDIDRGIVNIRVGFAPLKPAEFVVLYIQQMAGQA